MAAVYAFLLPWIASRIGRKATHSVSLLMGALGFASFFIFKNPNLLIISMIGVGIAFMGIFNFFITIPQVCNGLLGGFMVNHVYGGHTIYAMVFSGLCLLIAAVSVIFVEDKDDPVQLRLFKRNNN